MGTHLNFTLPSATFSYGKRNIISVKRKIQYSLYFPKSATPTSFNLDIMRNLNFHSRRLKNGAKDLST